MDRCTWITFIAAAGAAAVAAAAGCAEPLVEPPDEADEASAPPALGEVSQGICPRWACGQNSPEIDFVGFHELNLRGLPNQEGFVLLGLEQARARYQVRVRGGRISGVARGLPELRGADLVGARMLVERKGETYAIVIADVGWIEFPVGERGEVETYELKYQRVGRDGWTQLCGDYVLEDDHEGAVGEWAPQRPYWETFGLARGYSVVFEGDRLATATLTLNDVPEPDWFNIGCRGHTLSKLYLTRNAISSQRPRHTGRWAERQATLKLLTGDYCGIGVPFTVSGEALVWQGGDVAYRTSPQGLEARWDEHGAVCLEVPRMAAPSTAAGAAQFPDVEALIARRCPQGRPPRCDDPDPSSFAGALRVSANP